MFRVEFKIWEGVRRYRADLSAFLALPEAYRVRGTQGAASADQAVQQLSLKLQSRKAPVDTLVIDHFEKTPTENQWRAFGQCA